MIWDIDPIAIHTSVLSIRWYGIFLSVALIASYYHLRCLMVSSAQLAAFQRVVPITFLGSMLGARLGHFAFYTPELLIESPMILVQFNVPGLASHGAILGGTFAVWLVARWQEDVDFLWFLSRIAFSFVVFCILIRLGNFFNSELIGTSSHLPWAVQFSQIDTAYRHPVQLYESISYLICSGFLWAIYKQGISSKRLLGSVLVTMSLLRMALERFKAEQSNIELELAYTLGYLLTLPILIVGLALLVRAWLDVTKPRMEPRKDLSKGKDLSH